MLLGPAHRYAPFQVWRWSARAASDRDALVAYRRGDRTRLPGVATSVSANLLPTSATARDPRGADVLRLNAPCRQPGRPVAERDRFFRFNGTYLFGFIY